MVAFQISPKIESLYGILQLLRGCHLNNFPLNTLKLGWVAFHLVTFQLTCLDFQSNQYKKLVPGLSRFCNWLFGYRDLKVSFTPGGSFKVPKKLEKLQH